MLPITLVNLKQLRFMIDELKLGSKIFENKERETYLFCILRQSYEAVHLNADPASIHLIADDGAFFVCFANHFIWLLPAAVNKGKPRFFSQVV